jgi:hypothetical protein
MMKKMFLASLFGLGFLVGCGGGGGGGPGVEDFSTVYITSSIQKGSIDVDLIDYSLDNTKTPPCTSTIPMSDNENQTLTITVTQKPNLPTAVKPSDVVISDLKISFTPAAGQLDPCFNVAQPSGVYTINAPKDSSSPSSITLSFPVITQDIKKCMRDKYIKSDYNLCRTVSINFQQDPNNPNFYTVYATLTYKATEVNTGISKTITINLGTYRLSDFTSQAK